MFLMSCASLWPRFQKYLLRYEDLGFSIDISRMRFPDGFFEGMRPRVELAFRRMSELEAGAWLRRGGPEISRDVWLDPINQ